MLFCARHITEVWKKPGLSSSKTAPFHRVNAFPELVRKEALAGVFVLALACLLSATADAPIHGPSHPDGITAEAVKAPWIFVGIQQLLKYFDPLVAGVVLPFLGLLLIASLPYIPASRKAASLIFYLISLAALGLTIWGYLA